MFNRPIIPKRLARMVSRVDKGELYRLASAESFQTFLPLDAKKIEQSPLTERFSAISNITNAILYRFPVKLCVRL